MKEIRCCPRCEIDFEVDLSKRHTNKFCSPSCANSRGQHSEVTKQKMRKWANANKDICAKGGHSQLGRQFTRPKNPALYEQIQYEQCKIVFTARKTENRKFCGRICSNKNTFRINSTRKLRSIYKGFQMDSGTELKFAKLLDENNIKWIKNTSIRFEYKPGYFYIPDFYLKDFDLWIEIKAKYYLREDDELRWASVPNHEVIWHHDLRLPLSIINTGSLV